MDIILRRNTVLWWAKHTYQMGHLFLNVKAGMGVDILLFLHEIIYMQRYKIPSRLISSLAHCHNLLLRWLAITYLSCSYCIVNSNVSQA